MSVKNFEGKLRNLHSRYTFRKHSCIAEALARCWSRYVLFISACVEPTMTKKLTLWEAADRGVYKRSCGTYPDYEKASWRSERQLIEVLFTSTRVEPTPMTKQTDALSGSYRRVVIHVCVVWWYLVHLSFCTVVSSYRDFIIYGWTEQDAKRQCYY